MIDHLSTYATDYPVTLAFYRAVFEPLGYSLQVEFVLEQDADFSGQRICAFGPAGNPTFWIIEVREAYTPRHIAFQAKRTSEVDAFHRSALANGGSDHGPPGLRPHYHEQYYSAFVLDPDGNNVEAVFHGG